MSTTHDFIIIGGGSGGIAAARRAAEHGARVLLCEPNALGGTCVNRGCVPKKVMWNASQINDAVGLASAYGFSVDARGFDWHQLKSARDDYVARLNKIYADNLNSSGVELLPAAAKFCAPHKIKVDTNKKTYQAEHILIATGGQPTIPNLPGAELAITSDGFFELESRPRHPLIIGAGYIATELAGMLHGIGSDVTMLLRKDRLLRAFDFALGETVMTQMQTDGVDIRCNVQCEEIFRADDGSLGYRAAGDGADKHDSGFDCVLFAISRHPNTADLGLDAAGIKPQKNGFIDVDEFQNAAAGIYALGDVTPAAPLTPVAIAAGRHLADRLFGDKPDARLDYDNIPTVVFSHPPIGSVGLGYERAAEIYGADNIAVYESRFINMRYAISAHKSPTLVKLITTGTAEKIIGCHVVGDGADEMMQGFAVAVKMGATKSDFDNTIAIHPTAAEEMVTLR